MSPFRPTPTTSPDQLDTVLRLTPQLGPAAIVVLLDLARHEETATAASIGAADEMIAQQRVVILADIVQQCLRRGGEDDLDVGRPGVDSPGRIFMIAEAPGGA